MTAYANVGLVYIGRVPFSRTPVMASGGSRPTEFARVGRFLVGALIVQLDVGRAPRILDVIFDRLPRRRSQPPAGGSGFPAELAGGFQAVDSLDTVGASMTGRAGSTTGDSIFSPPGLASQFLPDGTRELWDAFNDLQRETTSVENVVRFLDVFARIDVSELAPQLRCPTLILHSLGDLRVPESQARELAALIPGSRLVLLESANHILTYDDPAWSEFLAEIDRFLI